VVDIPDALGDAATEAREHLLNEPAGVDDEAAELAVEELGGGDTVPVDALKAAIRRATLAIQITPVFCGSAFKNKGVQPLLDAVLDYLPSPLDVPPVEGQVERRTVRM